MPLSGYWYCTAYTTSGTSGLTLVPESLRYNHYLWIDGSSSSRSVEMRANGKRYYGTWTFLYKTEKGADMYDLEFDGMHLAALVGRGASGNDEITVTSPSDTKTYLFYER